MMNYINTLPVRTDCEVCQRITNKACVRYSCKEVFQEVISAPENFLNVCFCALLCNVKSVTHPFSHLQPLPSTIQADSS